jgi:hypothetical protein
MAKLSARGRKIIFEVEKEIGEKGVSEGPNRWERTNLALGSDGIILKKWTAEIKGVGVHDYGWKILGKVKPGLSAETVLEIYCKKGYKIKVAPGLDSDARVYCNTLSTAVAAGMIPPARTSPMTGAAIRSEKKASKEKTRKTKALSKRAEVSLSKNGPGFYVVNNIIGTFDAPEHERPFETYEEAEEFAWDRYRRFVKAGNYTYLPVFVIEASSRQDAWFKRGHIWWADGKQKGPPISPRQIRLPGIKIRFG